MIFVLLSFDNGTRSCLSRMEKKSSYLICYFLISYVAEQAQELELDSLVYSWGLELVLGVE